MGRSLKSRLLGVFAVCAVGTLSVVGCTAVGDSDLIPLGEESDDEDAGDTTLGSDDGDQDAGATTKKDSGTKPKDAGKTDAAKDSGPPPPAPGDACSKEGQIFAAPCGKCGTKEAICLSDGSGGFAWSDYGLCGKEIGNCEPGTSEACGNCGTRTCSNSCNWNSCIGEPADSCTPGSKSYTGAGCTIPQTYRELVCGATCQWGAPSATCAAPTNANKLTIKSTVGGTVSGNYELKASQVGNRAGYSCGGTVSSGKYPYELVEVKNATSKVAKVTAWLSGTPAIDTIMAVYDASIAPMSDADLAACVKVNDQCTGTPPCVSPWSALSDVTIQPGKVVLFRPAAFFQANAGNSATGPFTLTVKTDALN